MLSRGRLIVAYVALVVVPILGLIAILRRGQHLTAPLSVAGTWNLDADFSSFGSDPCRDLLARVNQPFMSISQSGADLLFSLNNPQKTTLPGIVQDSTLKVGATDLKSSESASEGCRDARAIHLEATVGKEETGQRVLRGKLSISGCAACVPVSFRAVQERKGR